MDRERGSPLQIMGPFGGLDTTHQPRELGPRMAVLARNVLLDNGTIQVRPPFEEDTRFAGFPQGKVYAGVDWYPPALSGALHNLETILHVGTQLFGTVSGGAISPVQQRQGSFVFAQGRLYYLDGRRVFRFDGTAWSIAGIPVPTTDPGPTATDQQVDQGLPRPQTGKVVWKVSAVSPINAPPAALAWQTTYQFAFAYYDASADCESNSVTTDLYNTGISAQGAGFFPVLKAAWGPEPTQRAISHLRVYVRNETAGETGYVLFYQLPIAPGFLDNYNGLAIAGDPTVGPFAPVKNGIPEFASVAWYYKSRMFYNDLRSPTLLRYSALGHPEHVDASDFEVADDDGGLITGMGEHAGQLAVVKERSLWVLAGTIVRSTNETIATGAGILPSNHEWYQSKVVVGCANAAGGNGCVRLPGGLGYNAVDGFYVFDGLRERKMSPSIDPTWRDFVGDATFGHNQAVSYGHDALRKIVYLVNLSTDVVRTHILAYHYELNSGAGGWTTLSPDDPNDNPTAIIPLVGTQDFNAPPDQDGSGVELRPTGLALAVSRTFGGPNFRILVLNDIRTDLPMPDFEYRTGELIVAEGLDAHFYWVKWFTAVLPPGALLRRVEIGFKLFPENLEVFTPRDLVGTTRLRQKIEGQGQHITLIVRKPQSGDSRWHPNVSILGMGMDAQPVGQ